MTEGLFLVTLIFLVYVVCLWLVPGVLKAFNNSHSIPSALVVSRYINSDVLEENGSENIELEIKSKNKKLSENLSGGESDENMSVSSKDSDSGNDPLGIR